MNQSVHNQIHDPVQKEKKNHDGRAEVDRSEADADYLNSDRVLMVFDKEGNDRTPKKNLEFGREGNSMQDKSLKQSAGKR